MNENNESIETAKRIINVSNSSLDKKIFKSLTVKQALLIVFGSIFSLTLSIICFIYISITSGAICLIILTVILILINIKQCLLLRCFIYFFKYLCNSRFRYINKLQSSNGIVVTKYKKYLFFEITCDPMIGTEDIINMKINDFVSSISQINNWSIINVNLPYSNLENNKNYILGLINKYVSTTAINENDPVLINLIMNQILINQFIEGEYKKSTFLFCCELNKDSNVKLILEQIQNVNQNLAYQNFKINAITTRNFEYVKNELLFFDKKVKINSDYIECDNKYYHFIKIDNLPHFVDQGYLDFLNHLADDENYDINFCINTYSIKSIKKEEKLWENAINFAEAELNRARKYKEQIESENNYQAVLELTSDLVNNKCSTQKYEIIISIKANSVKEILTAKRRVRNILKKQYQYDLYFSKFNQFALFNDFQRNVFINKPSKRILKILPNTLIAYSYPFLGGNTYLNKGLYLGQLFNGNPFYFSLNSGRKENNSSLIVGKTGSGKSTFIHFIVKNNMSEQNVITILIDPKGEYSTNETILKMHPQIINLDNTNDLVLNPFELCDTDTREAKVEFVLTFLKIWFENDWNLNIKNILIEAIDYSINNNCFNIVGVYEYLKRHLTQKNNINYLILNTLSNLLPSGVYNYFAKQCDFNLDNKLIIFNISSILSHYSNINKVKLLLLFKFLKKFIYTSNNLNDDNNQKIQVIVDEFPAIANPTAPFVVTEFVALIRLIRSYDTSLVLALQDITRFESMDVESNESLKSLANNIQHMFIMHLTDEQLRIMKNIWGDSVDLSHDEKITITTRFSKGDILYLNNASRFYFNSTYPLASYSTFDALSLNQKVINNINELKNKNFDQYYKNELMIINENYKRCTYELVPITNLQQIEYHKKPKKLRRLNTTEPVDKTIYQLEYKTIEIVNNYLKKLDKKRKTIEPIRTINISWKQNILNKQKELKNQLKIEKEKLMNAKAILDSIIYEPKTFNTPKEWFEYLRYQWKGKNGNN